MRLSFAWVLCLCVSLIFIPRASAVEVSESALNAIQKSIQDLAKQVESLRSTVDSQN